MTLKRAILLWLVLLLCLFFDATRNSSLVEFFVGEYDSSYSWILSYTSWISAAIALTVLPPTLGGNNGKLAALLSAIFSVCSVIMGHFASEALDISIADKKEFYESESLRLEKKLERCDKQPASVCSSSEVSEQIKINSQKLEESISTATLKSYDVVIFEYRINPPKVFKMICLLAVAIFIPYFSTTISDELRTVRKKQDEKQDEDGKIRPPARDDGTKSRTNGGTVAGTRDDKKPSSKGRGSSVPDDETKQKLLTAYNSLKRKGVKVTRDALRDEANVGNAKAGYWLKNCKPSNVTSIKTEEVTV